MPGAGPGQLDELINAIKGSSLLVEAAARRLEQQTPHPAAAQHLDRQLVDTWLQLVMDVAVIVADRPCLASKEMGARLQQMTTDIAAVSVSTCAIDGS